jgi:DNA replication protein DnaC
VSRINESEQDTRGLHPSLKQMMLESAARDRENQAQARALVLCDCPGHPHTLHEAWVQAHQEDYGRKVRAIAERAEVDIPRQLVRMGCPELHVQRLMAGQKGGKKRLEERPALQAARHFLGQPEDARRAFLVLCGPADSGKTLAAAAVLWARAQKYPWGSRPTGAGGDPFVFVRASTLARLSAWDDDARAFERRCQLARVLVLDDLGTEQLTSVGEMILGELIDVRYGSGRETVITTMLGPDAFVSRYDEMGGQARKPGERGRVGRRIRERGLVLNGGVLTAGDEVVKRFEKWKPTVVEGGKEKT